MITDRPRREAWSSLSSHSPREEPSLPTPWFWTPSLRNCEAITFCLSHPVAAPVAVPINYYKCQVCIPSTPPSLFRSSLENLACVHAKLLQSCPTLYGPVDRQAPLCMGFSRQEYWSGLTCTPPRDHPDLGIKPVPLTYLALAGGFFPISATWEAPWEPYVSLLFWLLLFSLPLSSEEQMGFLQEPALRIGSLCLQHCIETDLTW